MNHKIKNPNFPQGLISMAFLGVLFSLPFIFIVAISGQWDSQMAIWLLLPTVFCGVVGVMWWQGQAKIKQIEAFLNSHRPLVSWIYTAEEWAEMKEQIWQEQKGDWKLPLGCLTAIFSLVGLLVGIAVGADESFDQAVLHGGSGVIMGTIVGVVLGAITANLNHWLARQAYLDPIPDEVAIGDQEIFANGQYFKANGVSRYIQEIRFKAGKPAHLIIKIQTSNFRGSIKQKWLILVPSRLSDQVQAVIPIIKN